MSGAREEGGTGSEGLPTRVSEAGERGWEQQIDFDDSANYYFPFRQLDLLVKIKFDNYLKKLIVVELAYHIRYNANMHTSIDFQLHLTTLTKQNICTKALQNLPQTLEAPSIFPHYGGVYYMVHLLTHPLVGKVDGTLWSHACSISFLIVKSPIHFLKKWMARSRHRGPAALQRPDPAPLLPRPSGQAARKPPYPPAGRTGGVPTPFGSLGRGSSSFVLVRPGSLGRSPVFLYRNSLSRKPS
jgi:hypothetical protein